MKSNPPAAFSHHFRHLLILVVFFGLFVGVVSPAAKFLGTLGILTPPLVLLVAAPWLLGTLILLLAHRSPVKFWAAPLLLSLIAPALAFCHDWLIYQNWLQFRTPPNVAVTFAINMTLIGAFTVYLTAMCPVRCPECQSRALIPLRGLWGSTRRLLKTRWCASCGANYWRNSAGEWKEERRSTWLDETRGRRARTARTEEPLFDPHSRLPSPKINAASRLGASAENGQDSGELATIAPVSSARGLTPGNVGAGGADDGVGGRADQD
jgi:hypothetical protein